MDSASTDLGSKKIGVVIPSYNEGINIQTIIKQLVTEKTASEIVIVDDSSTLETVDAVNQLNFKNVEIIHRSAKGGRGSAVLLGMKNLLQKNCEIVAEMDADMSHPPGQLASLVQDLETSNLDLLIASRYVTTSKIVNWPLTRRAFSRCSNTLAWFMLRIPIKDYTNGYRIYSRRGAEVATETSGKLGKGFIALSEILVNLYFRGFRVGEKPTIFVNRIRGESSVTYKEVFDALFGLFKVYWLKRELKSAWINGNKSLKTNGFLETAERQVP